jgi:MFS family permease
MAMGRGRLRRWPLWVFAGIAVVLLCVLYAVWRSPPPRRDDLATYGAFAVAVIIIIPGVLAWARRRSSGGAADGAGLDGMVEHLAGAVRAQWEKAAVERGLTDADPIRLTWASPSLPVAGPAMAAVSSQRFAVLPGLQPARASQMASGQVSDLHAIYAGLGSGRLIITGAPGSGKSSAAVLLLLAALRYRDRARAEDKAKIPVPVLVTAQNWDPGNEAVASWLARQLQATYPQLPQLARAPAVTALMAAGRITVIIDGLDEIAAGIRPVALRALNQQASCRIVILSRTAEMAAAAARQGILRGAAAIELQPVSPADAVSYLERVQLDPPPRGWRDLTRQLRDDPAGPLSMALDNPLALSLVRDTCQTGDDAAELLAFGGTLNNAPRDRAVQAITDYLLDRVLPAAYTHQPGQPPLPYDLPTARNALTRIAAQMNRQGTRNLYWWQIPTWDPRARRQRQRAVGLVFGLVFWLAVGSAAGLPVGLAGGLLAGLFSAGGEPPKITTKLHVRKMVNRKNLIRWLVAGLVLGLVVGFMTGLKDGLVFGLAAGLAAGVVSVLAAGFLVGLEDAAIANPDSISSQSPTASWNLDRNYVPFTALVFGLMFGLAVGPVFGPARGLAGGLMFGLACGLMSSASWPAFLASAQMAIKWHTPIRLTKFLADAHLRNVLRTVGPAYQFRHARLQDRLAAARRPPVPSGFWEG